METAVATMEKQSLAESPTETGNIVQNHCRRAELFKKIQDIQIHNTETNRQGYFGVLVDKTNYLFIRLCGSKFGITEEQLKKLNREELDTLAEVVYEQSKKWYFVQASVCVLIPIFGWGTLIRNNFPNDIRIYNGSESNMLAKNMRYCNWYEKIRKLSGKNFSPVILIEGNERKEENNVSHPHHFQ